MAPKIAARVSRDPRQLRLGASGLEPTRAIQERIDTSLTAGASFRRVDQHYQLGGTGLVVVKRGQLTDLGRFALRRVEQTGVDGGLFKIKASEVTLNIPSIRAKTNRAGWRLAAPDMVTYSHAGISVDPQIYAAATTSEQQMNVVREAASEYIESRAIFRQFGLKILWKETDTNTYVLAVRRRQHTRHDVQYTYA